MICKRPDLSEKLILYAEGLLPSEEMQKIEDHLHICEACNEEESILRENIALIKIGAEQGEYRNTCPDDDLLVEYSETAENIPKMKRNQIKAHIRQCKPCSDTISLLNKLSGELASSEEKDAEKAEIPETIRIAIKESYGNKNGLKELLMEKLHQIFTIKPQYSLISALAVTILVIGVLSIIFNDLSVREVSKLASIQTKGNHESQTKEAGIRNIKDTKTSTERQSEDGSLKIPIKPDARQKIQKSPVSESGETKLAKKPEVIVSQIKSQETTEKAINKISKETENFRSDVRISSKAQHEKKGNLPPAPLLVNDNLSAITIPKSNYFPDKALIENESKDNNQNLGMEHKKAKPRTEVIIRAAEPSSDDLSNALPQAGNTTGGSLQQPVQAPVSSTSEPAPDHSIIKEKTIQYSRTYSLDKSPLEKQFTEGEHAKSISPDYEKDGYFKEKPATIAGEKPSGSGIMPGAAPPSGAGRAEDKRKTEESKASGFSRVDQVKERENYERTLCTKSQNLLDGNFGSGKTTVSVNVYSGEVFNVTNISSIHVIVRIKGASNLNMKERIKTMLTDSLGLKFGRDRITVTSDE